MSIPESHEINRLTQQAWQDKAAFWDNMMGDDGNLFHRSLVAPTVERLLTLQPGESVLDAGCGNGVLARRLAALGARVTAVDFSAPLLELARTRPYADQIIYQQVDATDEAALLTLGEGAFDAVVSTMALMDMAEIDPLFRAARRLLRPGGRFVVVVAHPSFNSNAAMMMLEHEDRAGEIVETFAVKVRDYLHNPPERGVGAVGEPTPHYYIHRPLHVLIKAAVGAGFVLNGLEEPAFPPEAGGAGRSLLTWRNFHHIPPVMGLRFI